MSLTNNSNSDSGIRTETQAGQSAALIFQSWLDQYQLIHHLILYSNILMVLQGRKGSGRSTYIKYLADKLPQDFFCKTINSNQLDSPNDLSLNLCQLFSLSRSHSENTITEHDMVEQIVRRQKHCLLIIDDAHHLSDEVITALLSCLQGQTGDVYFHCLFVGDPLLSSRLAQPPFSGCLESFSHIIDMPELELVDVKNYLNKVFSSLGSLQITALSDASLLEILSNANGNLNTLMQLAKAKLSAIPISSTPPINFLKPSIYQKRGMATIAIVLSFMIFAFVRTPSSPLSKTQQLALPAQNIKLEQERDEVKIAKFKSQPELTPTIDLLKKAKPPIKLSYVPMSMIPKYTLLAKKTLKKNKPKVIKNLNLNKEIISKGEKKNQKLALTSIRLKQKIVSRMEPETLARSKNLNFSELIIKKKNTPDKKSAVQSVRQHPSNVYKPSYGKGYGIQLVASTNIGALKRFARRYHIYQQATYYTKKTKGKNWYMLVLGDYNSKQQAARAQNSLPVVIKKKKLWIRSIKGLRRIE